MQLESKNYQNKLIRSFGRIKSRKLSENKNDLLKNFLKDVLIDFNKINKFNYTETKNVLEIGFGFGDFIFNHAKKNSNTHYFGFEPHLNGVVHLLELIKKNDLKNISISIDDIRLKIDNFPKNFFDQIYILFPDPWPKLKHHKRRLITTQFLDDTLNSKLKKDGEIIIASDHDEYQTWILVNILNSKNFYWTANSKADWQNFSSDWIMTKYQKKAINENRNSIILKIKKYK